MNLDDKIYVAGHRGMVGSAIVRRLQRSGYSNILMRNRAELDLRNQSDVEVFFQRERPDYVILAAAKVGGIMANNTYKAEFIYDNLMIAANVIEQSYRARVKKIINLGSSCIYPKMSKQPIEEGSLLTGSLEQTNEPYAIAKIAALKLCRYYREQYGFEAISLMPANLYGTNDNYNLETSHVFPALLRKMLLGKALRQKDVYFLRKDISLAPLGSGLDKQIGTRAVFAEIAKVLEKIGITEDAVTAWGSGSVRREFLHADDLANAALFFMEQCSTSEIGEIVNIGIGRDITIAELAENIRRAVGYEGKVLFDNMKPDGTQRKVLDVSKATTLGWKYSISLRDGLNRTIAEYVASRSQI